MGTAELKSHLHQLIDGINDNSVLQAVHTLLSRASTDKDWWDDLSDESKAKTLEGLQQAKKGEVISHDDAMDRMSKKFPNIRF
jgi:predicted transcriptional regulator